MVGEILRIAVDCDEPLADMNAYMQPWHNRNYRQGLPPIGVEDIFTFKLWDVWGCSKEEGERRILEFYESEDFRNMTPTPGSIEGVAAIAEDNDPFVLTSRVGAAIPQTKPFIDKHYQDYFDKIIFAKNYALGGNGHSKAKICDIENAGLLIDDFICYALECLEAGIPSILFDRPWNRESGMKEAGLERLPSGIVRAKNWRQAVALVDLLKNNPESFYKL
jgi:hypothetical protein